MDQFQMLGSVAKSLHSEFRKMFYLLVPLFFVLSLAITWVRNPTGGPDFIETVKRTFVATLLLVGFPEMSDMILFVTNEIAARVNDLSGLDSVIRMAGEKASTYTLSVSGALMGFNDLLIATLAFLSYLLLYVARYLMVAVFHFGWTFLILIAPLLLSFHIFSTKITGTLFRSLFEIASWKIMWAILSAMLMALPFGQAYMAEGSYLTVIVMNFVIAIAMLCTPLVVHSLVGNGISGFLSTVGPMTAGLMLAVPPKAIQTVTAGRTVLNHSVNFSKQTTQRVGQKLGPMVQPIMQPLLQRVTPERWRKSVNPSEQATRPQDS